MEESVNQTADRILRRGARHSGQESEDPEHRAVPYDFARPDRIAKEQIRAIHLLHENFARSLAASLSAYLRAYVVVNLVSIEQLSFVEFTRCLPAPSCIIAMGLRPYDGTGVLELNPSLVYPILEMLLGGSGSSSGSSKPNREITEIEQSIIEIVIRLILQNLRESWRLVTDLAFSMESQETEPSVLQFMAPTEALVAISMEVRVGESTGMMNIAIPSIIMKMLRQRFEQGWTNRRSESTDGDQERVFRLVLPSAVTLEARLQGPTLRMQDLLDLEEGDIVVFDHGVARPLQLLANGLTKFDGAIASAGNRRTFQVKAPFVTEGSAVRV